MRFLVICYILMTCLWLSACGGDSGDQMGADAAAGTDGSAKVGFMMSCSTNEQCETGLCFHYNDRGPLCSKPCTQATAATDCPAPSRGCNMMGICKHPG